MGRQPREYVPRPLVAEYPANTAKLPDIAAAQHALDFAIGTWKFYFVVHIISCI